MQGAICAILWRRVVRNNTTASDQGELLRLYAWLPAVRDALGVGMRAVVWVQGCSLHCPGCIVPETWSVAGGQLVDPRELAARLLQHPEIEGVTVSGGEPTEQAAAVAQLLGYIKAAGKNTWVYTGYTLEELLARHDPATEALLALTDVLVDGRYVREQAGHWRWRGSANQRILRLSDAIPAARLAGSECSQVEIQLDKRGQLVVVGVPPPGFLEQLLRKLRAQGIFVSPQAPWT